MPHVRPTTRPRRSPLCSVGPFTRTALSPLTTDALFPRYHECAIRSAVADVCSARKSERGILATATVRLVESRLCQCKVKRARLASGWECGGGWARRRLQSPFWPLCAPAKAGAAAMSRCQLIAIPVTALRPLPTSFRCTPTGLAHSAFHLPHITMRTFRGIRGLNDFRECLDSRARGMQRQPADRQNSSGRTLTLSQSSLSAAFWNLTLSWE